ncbi:MAG TPA: DUF1990 domain-containing protein [Pyrinomonadaceae bacterium]|nr:DUF1990 domain-containing protein [Pyrinomonadaceae bacterium]
MFLAKKPSAEVVTRFLASQAHEPFTYSEVGATKEQPPAGYVLDHNRVCLGHGAEVYERAIAGLRKWSQFDLGWVQIVPDTTPLEMGNVVAIQARTFGVWSLSACRVVYLINEEGRVRKFGFAYGTLTNHVERGEERFTIELQEDGSVWYDILAFSQPHQLLVRLGYPIARRLQKRFARESMARMAVAVARPLGRAS